MIHFVSFEAEFVAATQGGRPVAVLTKHFYE